jgi:hypothetical protein
LDVKHLTEFILQVFKQCIGVKEIVSVMEFWISSQLLLVIGFKSSMALSFCNSTLGKQAYRKFKKIVLVNEITYLSNQMSSVKNSL